MIGIPKIEDRCKRPCRWDGVDKYNDPEIYCVFLCDDETGCYPWCECDESLYESMKDRRDRPCGFNLTRDELTHIIISGILEDA